MITALAGLPVVAVDVETTGWLSEHGELTEIGAVRLDAGQVTGEFRTLVRPLRPVPAEITALTGISAGMVAAAPPPAAALAAFLAFAGDCVLAAHNAAFDLGFLTAAAAAAGVAWPALPVLDTAVLARALLAPEEVTDCKLATLARHFGAPAPCHRALPDARAAAGVLDALLARAAGRAPVARPVLGLAS